MAVAGSLVVNVGADASKLEEGFARARGASKGFAADTLKDLRKMTKEAGRFEKGLAVVTGGGKWQVQAFPRIKSNAQQPFGCSRSRKCSANSTWPASSSASCNAKAQSPPS